jgi:hypothetical protein
MTNNFFNRGDIHFDSEVCIHNCPEHRIELLVIMYKAIISAEIEL